MEISSKKDEDTYIINVGMNDKEVFKQLIDTDAIVRIVKNVCKGYQISFSISMQNGGYIMSNGVYVQENSIALKIIGLSESGVNDIAANLCCFLHQESVLIEKQKSTYYSISEEIIPDSE